MFGGPVQPPHQRIPRIAVHWLHRVGAGCGGPVPIQRAVAPRAGAGARAQRPGHHGGECAAHHPHPQHRRQQTPHCTGQPVAGAGHAGRALHHHQQPCAEFWADQPAGHRAVAGHCHEYARELLARCGRRGTCRHRGLAGAAPDRHPGAADGGHAVAGTRAAGGAVQPQPGRGRIGSQPAGLGGAGASGRCPASTGGICAALLPRHRGTAGGVQPDAVGRRPGRRLCAGLSRLGPLARPAHARRLLDSQRRRLGSLALGQQPRNGNVQELIGIADKENIAQHVVIASDSDEVKALQSTIKTADSYLEKETEYCAKPYSDFKTEYKEAQDALKHDTLYKANILEANTHLSNAIESLTKPEYKEVVKAATLEKDGSIDDTCVNCGDVRKSTPIAKIASIDLDKTSFTENGQAQKPSVTVKDSTGAVISADNYTVSYSDANSTKAGTYKVTVKFNGKKYAGTKELSYTISAKPAATTTVTNAATVKAPAKTTVKLSKAKKTSIKVSWKKVSGVAAYQIQYSTSKNFKKAKTVKVSAKSASKVLKKLKKNKKYYVRVRSYKVTKVNNKSKNVYSAWSAKKALKTKKK